MCLPVLCHDFHHLATTSSICRVTAIVCLGPNEIQLQVYTKTVIDIASFIIHLLFHQCYIHSRGVQRFRRQSKYFNALLEYQFRQSKYFEILVPENHFRGPKYLTTHLHQSRRYNNDREEVVFHISATTLRYQKWLNQDCAKVLHHIWIKTDTPWVL